MEGKTTTKVKMEIECEIRDKDGKLIKKTRQKADSLVKNFAGLLRGIMYGAANNVSTPVKDTTGTIRNVPAVTASGHSIMNVAAGVNDDSYGLQVGTGDAPVTRDDYKLESKISHGSGSGQLLYGAVTVESVNGTPPASRFRIIRTFTNNTTETITVKEIGLVCLHGWQYWTILIARDVLSTPQDVPSGATLTVRYIFEVTA